MMLRDERGVALITAMLVTALATTVAVAMASHQQVDIRRTANVLHGEQAYQYALGAEAWARHILARDDDATDWPGDDWAQVLPPMTVEGGGLSGYIEDMQGRFNLNNLLKAGEPQPAEVERFRRLLEALEIDPGLTQAVLDWLDEDINPRFPDGAEDDRYLQEQPPYRTGNAPMSSVSELRAVRGFDAQAYQRIEPYVCALPQPTPINVNTAEAPVLMTVAEDMSESDAQALIDARAEEGFESLQQFLSHQVLAGRDVDRGSLTVKSEHFLLNVRAEVGRGRAHLYSLIRRVSPENVQVLRRSQGTR